MPITLPDLDDRKYADLVEEALAMIPVHAPEWTNHNESDPGIALVELFAYLTEILIYRLNRVTAANTCAFLKLIDQLDRRPSPDDSSYVLKLVKGDWETKDKDTIIETVRLTDDVRSVVSELRRPYRAITFGDYSDLVIENFANKVARVFTTLLKDERGDKRMVDFVNVFVVPISPSTVLVRRKEGYSDHSSDLRNPGRIAFRLVFDKDDYLYIGMESKFDAVKFKLNLSVSNYTLRFEYSRGGDEDAMKPPDNARWAELTEKNDNLLDLTSSWASDGLVVFVPPADWRPSTVNARLMHWIRVSAEKIPAEQRYPTAFQVAVHSAPQLTDDSNQSLLKEIADDLENRRLLTTRVNVAGPRYKRIALQNITLHLEHDALEEGAINAAREELSRFFHPLIGWRDGKGWPFGRDVYLSEIIERLAGLQGVDFVESGTDPLLVLDPKTGEVIMQTAGSIEIEPFELVDFCVIESQFITKPAPDPRGLRQVR